MDGILQHVASIALLDYITWLHYQHTLGPTRIDTVHELKAILAVYVHVRDTYVVLAMHGVFEVYSRHGKTVQHR